MMIFARSSAINLLERIDQLHAFLSGNTTLADAAHLWVEAELVADEIERSPLAGKEEATAAQDLRDGVSSLLPKCAITRYRQTPVRHARASTF